MPALTSALSFPPESRCVTRFEKIQQIGEGTYGQVYMAKDKDSGEIVALKKVRMENEKEGFPVTALREASILLNVVHPHIVTLKEVVVGTKVESVFLVFEYCEHDLSGLLDNVVTPFTEAETKCLMQQILGAVAYLHDRWILHRDLKMSNLLFNNRGIVKIADFGLAREFGSPVKPYTSRVVTLWYRPPELLLGAKDYTSAIDMWSVGCIFGELLLHEPLLPGKTEAQQLNMIFNLLGTPTDKIWPGFSDLPEARRAKFIVQPYNNLRQKFKSLSQRGLALLNRLLAYHPEKRISAQVRRRLFEASECFCLG